MPDADQLDVEFDTVFWPRYPLKVAKEKARKAFRKARARVTLDALVEGLNRYIAHKPDWQAWAHAASWVNAGRWTDEYESAPAPRLWICPDDPPCPASTTQWDCAKRAALEKARRERQAS